MEEKDFTRAEEEDTNDAMAALFSTNRSLHQEQKQTEERLTEQKTEQEQLSIGSYNREVSINRIQVSKRKRQMGLYLDEEIIPLVKEKAKRLNISLNQYFSQLIIKDLKK